MKYFVTSMTVLFLLGLLLPAGCGRKDSRAEAPHPRIISQSPALTTMIFQLGLEDHLIGVGQYCSLPEAGANSNIPRVCDANGVKVEAAVAIQPDIILTQSSKGLFKAVQDALPEVAVEEFRIETLEDVRKAISRLGKLCGAEDKAAALLKDFDAAMMPVEHSSSPRVLFMLGSEQPSVPVMGTFIDDMITRAGGMNVGNKVPGTALWRPAKLEAILACQPTVLIIWTEKAGREKAEAFWKARTEIPAVQSGHIYFISDDRWLRPDTGLIPLMPRLREMIWGEKTQ